MSEHFPANAIGEECTTWCNVCNRLTRHQLFRVHITSHASKAGPCLEHGPKVNARGESKKQETARQRREEAARSPRLFP